MGGKCMKGKHSEKQTASSSASHEQHGQLEEDEIVLNNKKFKVFKEVTDLMTEPPEFDGL
eukprot:11191550-Lingulodinium_polyedra.AAC.1